MSTVLIYTSPARGHLYPIMDVALALQDAGHRVVVQTLAGEKRHLEAAGVEHRSIAPQIEDIELADYRARGTKGQFEAALRSWAARAPHEVVDMQATQADVQPDITVVDANCWGAAALAESTGHPWAMFMPYCLPVPSPDAPAFGPGFSPPRNTLERVRDRVVWAALDRMASSSLTMLNTLRAELGVPRLHGLPDLYLQSGALLYRTAEPFEYPRRDWPDQVHLIGPGLWSPTAERPSWLDALPRPRVLVSVSTELQEDGAIVDAALTALADQPGSIIVTTSALDPTRFVAPNDRTRILRFVSHAAVMDAVDVVVTHGGMGTTQRALAAGVPLVVVPWGRDQKESARRVQHSGAGVMLAPKQLAPDRLRAAVRAARERTEGARRVAAAFATAGGATRAVEILQGLRKPAAPRLP
jgi:MGT family glycosyltransferase